MNQLPRLLLASLACLPATNGLAAVGLGEQVTDLQFGELRNGDGRSALSQFRGQPIVIMDWTMDNTNALQYGVPKATDLYKQYAAAGLVVILHETSPDSTPAERDAFMLRQFPGNPVWVSGPLRLDIQRVGDQFLPRFAVIGADGSLLAEGVLWTEGKELDQTIAKEMKQRKTGWGSSAPIRKARALLHGQQDCAGAAALLDGLKAGEADATELAAVRTEIHDRLESLSLAAEHFLAAGECSRSVQAAETLEALVKACGQASEYQEKSSQLSERIATPEFQAQLMLEKKLLSITKSLARKRPKGPEAKQLRKLAEQNPESAVAQRALRLAERIEIATRKT